MITSADIEAYYNITLTTEQKDRLDNYIIPALVSFMEKYCNRVFAKATFTENYDGGVDSFFIKNPPIVSVTSLEVDGGALTEGDDFKVYETYIRLFSTPSNHTSDVDIEYEGGYDPVPQDVLNSLIRWAYGTMLDDDADSSSGGGVTADIKRFTAGSVTVEYATTASASGTGSSGSTQAQVVGVPDYVINTLQYYRLTPIR